MKRQELKAVIWTGIRSKKSSLRVRKSRFILSEGGNFIRAGYGHSIGVDLELRPKTPPDLLYHGTAKRNTSSILEEGIRPGIEILFIFLPLEMKYRKSPWAASHPENSGQNDS